MMTPDLDCAHLEVAVVRAPLGGLLAGVLIVPINGILKIRWGNNSVKSFYGMSWCFNVLPGC